MTTRVVFVQPYLASYRVAFYEQLSAVLEPHDMCVEVVVGRDEVAREDQGEWPVSVWPDSLGRWTHDRVRFRRGHLGRQDLVVVEQAIRNVDSWLMLARPRVLRPAIAMWGHGRPDAEAGTVDRLMKRYLTNRVDWFFGYTRKSVDHVVAEGFPRSRTSVVGNTIDTRGLEKDLVAVTDCDIHEFQQVQRLRAGRTALFLGGVDEAKDIDFVLASASAAADRLDDFAMVVAGAGSQLDEVRRAEAAGYPVRVVGRVDGFSKALVLRAADVLAVPRGVGLVAVDSLVAGCPIVTVDGMGHGPEEDYLGPDECVRVAADSSADEYGGEIARILREPDTLGTMASACRERSEALRMEDMVERFREGLLALRDIHEHGL